ncbi:hypothetical protein SPBR_03381 [Sporothrix brasiliensis 5110]|uniref:Uncharacterized protein n=1 Tax=Sporothrix brasiliensis 5110 TaxID=1398154 RepID=A0A0C2EZR2_9PEZI|nr:uncharacterized protein SPBR_03381 [Sporothrix brasiliensis 5110]KIH92029.1 hypothetical protein SPBR_03381 [Sporothrix brasiliensis 5110]
MLKLGPFDVPLHVCSVCGSRSGGGAIVPVVPPPVFVVAVDAAAGWATTMEFQNSMMAGSSGASKVCTKRRTTGSNRAP